MEFPSCCHVPALWSIMHWYNNRYIYWPKGIHVINKTGSSKETCCGQHASYYVNHSYDWEDVTCKRCLSARNHIESEIAILMQSNTFEEFIENERVKIEKQLRYLNILRMQGIELWRKVDCASDID